MKSEDHLLTPHWPPCASTSFAAVCQQLSYTSFSFSFLVSSFSKVSASNFEAPWPQVIDLAFLLR